MDPQSGGTNVGANCFTDDPFDTSCLIYISSLMEEETAAAAQPWLGALSGAEVGVGALGRPSPHLPLSGYLGGQRGQGQCGQDPAACGVALLSPPVPLSPWGQGRLRCAGTCCKDLWAGVRCPSRMQVAENALRHTGHDEKTGFLRH